MIINPMKEIKLLSKMNWKMVREEVFLRNCNLVLMFLNFNFKFINLIKYANQVFCILSKKI
jgi:hypothetical protein